MIQRRAVLLGGCAALAGCGGADNIYAPLTEVSSRAYRDTGPAYLTLMTSISNREGGRGEHSALIISASQRVAWDPAGTYRHPLTPERGDVHFGMTDDMLNIFLDYHARPAFRLMLDRLPVAPQQAEQVLTLAQEHGPAQKATCVRAITGVLRAAGFSSIQRAWYPDTLRGDFSALPGVTTTLATDATPDVWSATFRDTTPTEPGAARFVLQQVAT